MKPGIRTRVARSYAMLRAHPDRGVETVDMILWMAVTIVVVAAIGLLFKNAITNFFNSIVFSIGM
ncbi:MAG TPA: hypothetical protein VF755_13700 [Catenuloplanes sp.]|jgi:hypothetical protein